MIIENKRINKLRDAILKSEPTLGTERAWIVTRAYEKYKNDSIDVKRAKALRDILSEMTIYITEGDLIAGNQGHSMRCPPVYPENSIVWIDDEHMDSIEQRSINPLRIPQKEREELKKIAEFWKGETLVEHCYSAFTDEILKARKSLVFSVSLEKNAIGHCVLDNEKILNIGYNGLIRECETELLKPDIDEQKKDFLNAALIVCDAAIMFAHRYADLALELAAKTDDQERKEELVMMSHILRKVPAGKAESFQEGLQSIYLAHIINTIETNAYSMSFGRLDQYLYPLYKKDLDKGVLTQEKAQEILNCFWVRTNDLMHVDDKETVYFHGGHPFGQHLTVGGMDADGENSANELSYMCLDAHATVRLYQPDFSVRVNEKTPKEFKERTVEVIRMGLGLPQLFNDEIVIKSLVADGIPLREARDYTPTGCVENSTPNAWVRAPGGWFNMVKILEICLHEGNCPITGNHFVDGIPAVEDIKSYKEFYKLYIRALNEMINLHVKWSNIIDDVHKKDMPQISVSVLTGDCIKNGRDAVAGGARYNFTSPLMVGIANIADSLSVIKTMVFEEKSISLRELVKALDDDFKGYEKLLMKINAFDKRYGNDLEEVDQIAYDVTDAFCEEFSKHSNTRGGKFRVGFWSVTANFNLGMGTGASPDGKRAFEPLSDSLAPNAGKDINGLTASLCSVAKLPQNRASNGAVLNRHLNPVELKDKPRMDKLIDIIDGYFEMGGSNLGLNIVSADTLKKAKETPEDYTSLMVKVAGYAAYFNELGDSCKDNIIERTEHELD